MSRLTRWLAPTTTARAHCDLPCGVYDPEQARIEAESCHRINEKYAANEDAAFRTRAVAIKEERAELVKHHLDVLWHDYFKPEHLEKVPNLHELFWNATKQVSKVKASTDAADVEEAARPDRRDRRRLEGDRRRREDPRRRPARLTADPVHDGSRGPAGRRGLVVPRAARAPARPVAGRRRAGEHANRRSRPATGCSSIRPSTRWPRRGSVVVFREPDGERAGRQARRRHARRPRAVRATASSSSPRTRPGSLSDATAADGQAAGFGEPIDSRRYGPVPLELLVGRAWFRYWPWRRIGRIDRAGGDRPRGGLGRRRDGPRVQRQARRRGSPRRRRPARRASATSASGSRRPGRGRSPRTPR